MFAVQQNKYFFFAGFAVFYYILLHMLNPIIMNLHAQTKVYIEHCK